MLIDLPFHPLSSGGAVASIHFAPLLVSFVFLQRVGFQFTKLEGAG